MGSMDWGYFFDFLGVSLFLGALAMWFSGRVIALAWASSISFFISLLFLVLVVRFFDYALFEGDLLSFFSYLFDFSVLFIVGLLGYRLTRAKQLITQYPWLYRRSVFFYTLRGES